MTIEFKNMPKEVLDDPEVKEFIDDMKSDFEEYQKELDILLKKAKEKAKAAEEKEKQAMAMAMAKENGQKEACRKIAEAMNDYWRLEGEDYEKFFNLDAEEVFDQMESTKRMLEVVFKLKDKMPKSSSKAKEKAKADDVLDLIDKFLLS